MTSDVAAVTEFYGRWARLYDLLARNAPGVGSLRGRAAAALNAGRGETVLEMGCGTGANLPYLRERVGAAGQVIGLDLTRGMLARAGGRGGELVQGDATRPPVRGPLAGVLATFVVGMLEDPDVAVRTWCDLVAPGGRVVLLDAASSPDPRAGPLNAAFRAFVAATAPPTRRLRYEEPPAARLDERVATARDALAERGEVVLDERHAAGLVRLTAARVQA